MAASAPSSTTFQAPAPVSLEYLMFADMVMAFIVLHLF
jgi:hypothetical protein